MLLGLSMPKQGKLLPFLQDAPKLLQPYNRESEALFSVSAKHLLHFFVYVHILLIVGLLIYNPYNSFILFSEMTGWWPVHDNQTYKKNPNDWFMITGLFFIKKM